MVVNELFKADGHPDKQYKSRALKAVDVTGQVSDEIANMC